MSILTVVETAVWSLGRNKLRTGLTMLGIVVGVAAVIAMTSLGQGAIQSTEDDIRAMGSTLITIAPGTRKFGGFRGAVGGIKTLVPDDITAIARECPDVDFVSPGERTNVQVVYGDQNASTSLQGGSVEFFTIRNWPVVSGLTFDVEQVHRATKVCVIGATVARQLFGEEDPVGAIIRLNKVPFQVIGLLATKGQSTNGQDQDDIIVAPWTSVMRRVMGITHLTMALASARDEDHVSPARDQISALLHARHRIPAGQDDDFSVETQREVADAQEQTARLLMILVTVVAIIALLVGGVGVMNIMLASVLERTREIGIRMSVGARQRDVLRQFLGEAVLLTSLGGALGVLTGVSVALLIPRTLGWPTHVTVAPAALSLLFSAAVGIGFGYYPALRACRMDPIEALRAR